MLKKPNLNKPIFTFFPHMKTHIENNECPLCEKIIKESDFTDELSKKEYGISGLCQSCQDGVFLKDEKEK